MSSPSTAGCFTRIASSPPSFAASSITASPPTMEATGSTCTPLEYPLPVTAFAARAVCLAIAAGPVLVAQDSALRFEVASVKPNVGADQSIPIRPHPSDGIVMTNFPLESIIRYAYSVQPFRLENAPAWTRNERFDIAAKAGRPIPDDERR